MKYFILIFLIPINVFALRFTPVTISSVQSMASSFQSSCVDMNQLQYGAIQASWTGSPVGSVDVQISNSIVVIPPSGIIPCSSLVWSDYTGSAQAINGAGNFTWNLTIAGYHYIRLAYTASSGSGTFGAIFTGKGN